MIKCAGCFKDIPIENEESLCIECQKQILGTKVSWEDPPKKEDISENIGNQNSIKKS